MLRKKRFALVPSERQKICLHRHCPYRGRIPATGPRVCTMCGMEFASDEEIDRAQEEVEEALQLREKLAWIEKMRGRPMTAIQRTITEDKILREEFVGAALALGGGKGAPWLPLVDRGGYLLRVIRDDGFYDLPSTVERVGYTSDR